MWHFDPARHYFWFSARRFQSALSACCGSSFYSGNIGELLHLSKVSWWNYSQAVEVVSKHQNPKMGRRLWEMCCDFITRVFLLVKSERHTLQTLWNSSSAQPGCDVIMPVGRTDIICCISSAVRLFFQTQLQQTFSDPRGFNSVWRWEVKTTKCPFHFVRLSRNFGHMTVWTLTYHSRTRSIPPRPTGSLRELASSYFLCTPPAGKETQLTFRFCICCVVLHKFKRVKTQPATRSKQL